MTRFLTALTILLLAGPAWAQEGEVRIERHVIVNGEEVDTDDEDIEVYIGHDGEASGEARFEIRRGDDDVRVFRLDGTEGVRMWREGGGERLREMLGGMDIEIETLGEGIGPIMGAFFGGPLAGASDETRQRIRELESQARDHARDARDDDTSAEADLDRTLGELFEARGQARREAAEALRERARDMMERADESEAAAAARENDRARLIEERKADLLGRPSADW